MPDSPVFPEDFGVQENLGISQPSLPFPCCRPGQSLVAPHTQPPALAACPHSRQPAGSRAGRRTRRGAHIHGSPTCRISQRIRVSWMLLRAKGHSCLSSRLLFSRTNWRRGSLPCVMWATDSEGKLYPPSRAIPYRNPPKKQPQPPPSPAAVQEQITGTAGQSVANALQPLAGFAQIVPVCSEVNKAWKPSCGQNTKNYGDPSVPPASRGCSYPQGRTWLDLKQGKSRTTAQKGHPRLGLAKDRSQGK